MDRVTRSARQFKLIRVDIRNEQEAMVAFQEIMHE